MFAKVLYKIKIVGCDSLSPAGYLKALFWAFFGFFMLL